MDSEERRHLENLLNIHRESLYLFEKQAAAHGISVPSLCHHSILHEKREIARIEEELAISAPAINRIALRQPRQQVTENTQQEINSRNQIFISYSHSDTRWLNRLQVHLKPLERMGTITRWDDTLIDPGEKWYEEIKKAIDTAKVAVLLVSADFLASDFISNNELPPLLAAGELQGAVILSVIVSSCRFKQTKSICQFQAVNSPSRPLNLMSKGQQEAVFVKVSEAIEKALQM